MNKYEVVRLLSCLSLSALLSACANPFGSHGVFKDRSMSYQKAKSIEPYVVGSESASTPHIKSIYAIPAPAINASAETELAFLPVSLRDIPRPKAVDDSRASGKMRLFQTPKSQGIWFDAEMDQVNSWVKTLLSGLLYELDLANSSNRLILTSWKEDREQLKNIRRIAVQLMPGTQQGGVFAHFMFHQQNSSTTAVPSRVEADQGQQKRVTKLVDPLWSELVEGLVALVEMDSQSDDWYDAKAQKIMASVEQDGNGYPVLKLNLSVSDSWENVTEVLQKMHQKGESLELATELYDVDRSLGLYYLKNNDENFTFEPALSDESEDESIADHTRFQMRLATVESGSVLYLQINDDTVAPKDFSLLFLEQLQRKLNQGGN